MHTALAALIASLAPAAVFGGLALAAGTHTRWVLVVAGVAYVIALAHIALLGVPCIAVLRRFARLNWVTVCLCGFLLGSLFYVLVIALGQPSASHYSYRAGSEWLIVNGVVTTAGWLQYFASTVQLGLVGALTGVAFYALLLRAEA